jgi:hypothetical protein
MVVSIYFFSGPTARPTDRPFVAGLNAGAPLLAGLVAAGLIHLISHSAGLVPTTLSVLVWRTGL